MKKSKLLTFFVTLIYMFLFAPLVIIVTTAFGSKTYITFPPQGFSLKWFSNIFSSEMFMRTFKMSIEISVLATIIALIVGIPAAYSLSRYEFKGKSILKNIFFSPIIVPGIVFGFALFNFIIIKLRLPIFTSLIIGHTVIIIPYIIRVIASSLESFDYSIEEAAISLGSGSIKTFFLVVFPNITSGVIAAFMLAFINSFNNVPVSIFLTGPGVSTLPITMMSYIEYNYDPTVSALSVVLMIMTIIIMFIVEKTLGLSYFSK
ncbi:ABC transporter permease [Clostridium aestuarii]|uniref:ABC transporter permease n=1 Tax=Clostridium aestuarii TaxID=338193 RepID=A0ABT4CVA3_9CLOT|nr:ABC transporter permease [Clostridium aestuarii]MCY6482906.1 ABC transporter permease [Clostridium aestuarii]